MGRGLSPLQRHILTEAAKQRRLYYVEILVSYFGWKPTNPIIRYGQHHSFPAGPRNEAGSIVGPGSQHFSRTEIGEQTYRKVMATLSRACQRLDARGLVTCLSGVHSRWA